MPTFLHEALVGLLRDRPELLARLLRGAGLSLLPPHEKLVSDSADLGSAQPSELAADAVLRVEQEGRTEMVVVLEVQLRIDPRKVYTWPLYVAAARARHERPTILVVVTPDRHVAKWAGHALEMGPGTGYVRAAVLGPDELPRIEDAAEAVAAPALAVLSAVAHGQDDDAQQAARIGLAAMEAILQLGEDEAAVYLDYVKAALSEAAKEALAMIPQNYEFQDEGLRKAWHGGKAEGEAKGKAEGEAKGKADGLASALLLVLEARGLAPTAAEVDRIRGCGDVDTLAAWLRQAPTAGKIADVFL
ncbi:MAG: hypothetical protein SF187_24960 [Deltaproteobacteria bacterium]|nr:hypothetical protein [Deltaproteobacteria bacterium]